MDKGGKDLAEGAAASKKTGRTAEGRKDDWVGRQLRRVYDDALSEPIPDDLMSLLQQLDKDKPKF